MKQANYTHNYATMIFKWGIGRGDRRDVSHFDCVGRQAWACPGSVTKRRVQVTLKCPNNSHCCCWRGAHELDKLCERGFKSERDQVPDSNWQIMSCHYTVMLCLTVLDFRYLSSFLYVIVATFAFVWSLSSRSFPQSYTIFTWI